MTNKHVKLLRIFIGKIKREFIMHETRLIFLFFIEHNSEKYKKIAWLQNAQKKFLAGKCDKNRKI